MGREIIYALIALPLAAILAFAGWRNSFSSMADPARKGAYTAHLPEWIGRPAGRLKMAGALALVAGIHPAFRRPWVAPAAVFTIVSQIVSSIVHYQHAETSVLPQNAAIAVAGLAMVMLARDPAEAERTASPA